MLEEKTVRSSMEQWGQAVSGSEQINLQSQLEKKHMELEVSMGQGEQTCMHNDIFMEMEQHAGGAYQARERRKMPLLTMK